MMRFQNLKIKKVLKFFCYVYDLLIRCNLNKIDSEVPIDHNEKAQLVSVARSILKKFEVVNDFTADINSDDDELVTVVIFSFS